MSPIHQHFLRIISSHCQLYFCEFCLAFFCHKSELQHHQIREACDRVRDIQNRLCEDWYQITASTRKWDISPWQLECFWSRWRHVEILLPESMLLCKVGENPLCVIQITWTNSSWTDYSWTTKHSIMMLTRFYSTSFAKSILEGFIRSVISPKRSIPNLVTIWLVYWHFHVINEKDMEILLFNSHTSWVKKKVKLAHLRNPSPIWGLWATEVIGPENCFAFWRKCQKMKFQSWSLQRCVKSCRCKMQCMMLFL